MKLEKLAHFQNELTFLVKWSHAANAFALIVSTITIKRSLYGIKSHIHALNDGVMKIPLEYSSAFTDKHYPYFYAETLFGHKEIKKSPILIVFQFGMWFVTLLVLKHEYFQKQTLNTMAVDDLHGAVSISHTILLVWGFPSYR